MLPPDLPPLADVVLRLAGVFGKRCQPPNLENLAACPDLVAGTFFFSRATLFLETGSIRGGRSRLADTVARIQKQAAGARATTKGDREPETDDELDADEAAAVAVLGIDGVVSVPLAGKTASLAVTVGEICWIESLRNYTRVALKPPAGVLLFRRRLAYRDHILPAGAFARVGRS